MTPARARHQALVWDGEFKDFLSSKGLGSYAGWDRLPSERKRELELIWEAGHDNITREKCGIEPVDDVTALAIAIRHREPPRRRRVR